MMRSICTYYWIFVIFGSNKKAIVVFCPVIVTCPLRGVSNRQWHARNIPFYCRINIKIPKVVCFRVFAISSANSHQILIKFSFPESTWNCQGFKEKKSGKIRIPGKKTGLLYLFPTFGLQFSTDFYKFWFSRVLRSPWLPLCKKIPEKSGFREKTGLNIFPDFFGNGFFT